MGAINEVLEYLDKLPEEERVALGKIRDQIWTLVPDAEERLSRGVPFFYYRGKRTVGFRSSKTHLSFFIMEGNVLNNHRKELSEYENSSTVVKFSSETPLHEELIQKLVLARIDEIDKVHELKKSK